MAHKIWKNHTNIVFGATFQSLFKRNQLHRSRLTQKILYQYEKKLAWGVFAWDIFITQLLGQGHKPRKLYAREINWDFQKDSPLSPGPT